MEGDHEKQKGSSNLVGSKCSTAESESSSSGVFSTLFPQSTKEPFHFLEAEKKKNECGSRDTKTETSGNKAFGGETANQNTSEKDDKGLYVRDEKAQPFHYSSSIYYGGQDHVLTQNNPSGQKSDATKFNKDGGEDDSNSASRGNWWQGSLYY